MDEIKKILKEKSLTFGTEEVLKKIRLGEVKKVFLASNCNKDIKEKIERYAKVGKIQVVNLDIPNDEVGVICKKPFAISVLCY